MWQAKWVEKTVGFDFVPLSATSSLKNWPAETSNLPVAPSLSFQSEVTHLSIPSKGGRSKKVTLSQQAVQISIFSSFVSKHRLSKWHIKVRKIGSEQMSRYDAAKRTLEGIAEVNFSGGRSQNADQQQSDDGRLHEVFSCVSMRKGARKL